MMAARILFIYGTRPEAIKLAPVIKEFKRHSYFETQVCVTAQHREMMDRVNEFFEITPDFDLDLMTPNQTLEGITAAVLSQLEPVLSQFRPHVVFVQGDTSTVLSGSLAAFYRRIEIAHVEAGLRSYNNYSPFPEEMNRRLTSALATYHFAPTEKARFNLEKENITKNVSVVGNTVIDALVMALEKVKADEQSGYLKNFEFLDFGKKILLVTGHRRESFGKPFEEICGALKEVAEACPDVQIVYPVHLNPNVQKPVHEILSNLSNVFLIRPLDYPLLVWLLEKCYLVLTDSGGIQEEAPSLGKPVLVMREVTERTEGIEAGVSRLVGVRKDAIVQGTMALLHSKEEYEAISEKANPYGDGHSSEKIERIMYSEMLHRGAIA
jgi:UDP-N-acetylglucosamine 2-epimerase (non-hydrolysing)